MQLATYNSLKSQFVTAYEAAHGPGSAGILPPGLLQAIIQMLLAMISGGGCLPPAPTPAQVKAAFADPANAPWIAFEASLAITQALGRQAARRVPFANVMTATHAAVAAAEDATIQAVVDSSND